MNFQDVIPSLPTDNFKNHCKLAFDLVSLQDATEECHYPELVGEPPRQEPKFNFPQKHNTELFVLAEKKTFLVADDK